MIGLSVVMEILFSVLVIQLYTIVKVPQHEHLRFMHCIVYNYISVIF